MKKFTGNFLLGEHSFGNVLRKIGLSMVAILLAVAVNAQGTSPQETYHVWAEDVSDCYRLDNDYVVQVSVQDFIKIDTFVLVLNYNSTLFSYKNVTDVHSVLASKLKVTESTAGTLTFEWDSNNNPLGNGTISPDDSITPIFNLHFELTGYPYSYGIVNQFVVSTDLKWDNTKSKFWNKYPEDVTDILTDLTTNGSVTVTQGMEEVVVDVTAADCDGQDAIAVVSTPAEDAYEYSFNGASFTTNPQANVTAPSTNNTLRVMDGECVSYIKKFDVTAPKVLSFDVESTVEVDCDGGLGDIEIFATGGTKAYTYYIVPDASWTQVSTDLAAANLNTLTTYAKTNNILERGPGIYHIAVQDANDCKDLRDLSWWKQVEVVDNVDPWNVTVNVEDLGCFLGTNVSTGDGSVDIAIDGATPFMDGYNVWFNDVYAGRVETLLKENLAAGSYKIHIADSVGCEWDKTVEIIQPEVIDFEVNYTDASCEDNNGTLSIDVASITGGSGAEADWWWVYSTTPNFTAATTDTLMDINATASGLAPSVYYVRLFDGNGCFADFKNANSDNAIKVLTTDFDLVYDEIGCNGGSTDVSIVLTTGAGNHEFEYRMDSGAWQDSNDFADVSAGIHTFEVHDITIDCTYGWTKDITEPEAITAEIVPWQTLPPTCPENTDGNLAIRVMGGTPFVSTGGAEYYQYRMDEGAWVQASMYNTFAIDTARHTIYIEDANGCQAEVMVDWPNNENIIEFVDTIYNNCAMGMINLFNKEGEGCDPMPFDLFELYDIPVGTNLSSIPFDINSLPDGIQESAMSGLEVNGIPVDIDVTSLSDTATLYDLANMLNQAVNSMGNGNTFDFWNPSYYNCPNSEVTDFGYMNYFEWYGIPLESFTGTLSFEIKIWTSDSGWVTRSLQGVQVIRDPAMYITDVDPSGNAQAVVDNGEVLGFNSAFGAGTYWVVAMDEWGCHSNIEKIVIMDPPALDVTWSAVAAGCDGSTDGQIRVEAMNGTVGIPNLSNDQARYQYVLTQQPQIFTHDNWVNEVSWSVFTGVDFENDSVLVKNVQAGTYWLAVRDWCGVENTDLIQYVGPIVVEGADAVEVNWDSVTVSHITCNVDGQDPSNDGSISGLLDATTGGFGDYTYTLEKMGGETAWTKNNQTGEFVDLTAGMYELTIEDDSLGCMATYNVEIKQPKPFKLAVDVVNVGCFDAHNGIMRYKIWGGTAPYSEVTNNVGVWENASEIPADRWYNTGSEAVDMDGYYMFDRRVRAGSYQVWIKDAKGCIYGPVKVVIEQPDELAVTMVDVMDVSCNNQDDLNEGVDNDGEISFMPAGGWNMDDNFTYYAELWKGTTKLETVTFDQLEEVTFDGYAAGDYTIKLYETNGTITAAGFAKPYISYTNYFNDSNWLPFMPYQNANIETCFALYDVTIGQPDAITYDEIDWRSVKCYNTASGEIYLPNIQGGTPSATDGYYVGLEGPTNYDSSLQTNFATNKHVFANSIQWFKTGAGSNEFTFDHLTWGHYTVHIMDANGCWIYKESGEVENPDTLKLQVVELVENASCNGGTGTIQIDAVGGTGSFMYAVDATMVPNPESKNFPNDMDLDAYLAGLNWQASDTFEVTAGTWIGYVKDESGCIAGFSTDAKGAPIYHHRTTVLQPNAIVASNFGQVTATCYGDASGKITIGSIAGGNGASWTIQVMGTDYTGAEVNEEFTVSASSNVTVSGLMASTTKTDPTAMTADDKYSIYVYDNEGCVSAEYTQYVMQPEPFEVVLKDKQNAFVCPNDKAGIFEIQVISGGTPFGTGADGKPLYEYKWEAYSDSAYTMAIDSLTDNEYGYVKTFLGYAGIHYRVFAQDANGCETQRDTFIQAPQEVTFTVEDLTCHGADLAAARVNAVGTPERTFRVLYREIENDVPTADTFAVYGDSWFTDYVDITDVFKFDNENFIDRHYAIMVEDNFGCRSIIDTVTFDAVQTALSLNVDVVETSECNEVIDITFDGGVDPYVVMVNDSVIADYSGYMLSRGTNVVKVMDAHMCEMTETIEVVGDYVTRDTTIETFIGEATAFVDAEAGVDTMLALGTHEIIYNYEGCERTLNVEVVEVPRPLSIADVNGTEADSPWAGTIVKVTGTVTGVSSGEGFFMQDANEAWSGLWVVYTETGDLAIGDGVEVVGEVSEIVDVTSVTASEVTEMTAELTVEPIVLGSPLDVEQEKYESMVVKVEGARANAVEAVTGEWTIYYEPIEDAIVNDLLFAYEPVEGNFFDVTGIVNARLDAFKLEPRMEEDIVDITATTPAVITPANVEFKVYPNPFNESINIVNSDKLTRVVISNVAGQRVMDIEYPNKEIRTANLVSGVYIISMYTENGIAKSERIVKR